MELWSLVDDSGAVVIFINAHAVHIGSVVDESNIYN
jgi:hypothetical protein